MSKTAIQQELDASIPKDVVHTRSQAGRDLSYLETWYVIDRLNQVLGQGNWGYQTVKLDKVFEGKVEQYSGEVYATSYTAQVSLLATLEQNKTVVFSDVGYGDGTDKKNPGKAHELAVKEAVSDGLKRAAKNLGRSMGLALYDKTQKFVDPWINVDEVTDNKKDSEAAIHSILNSKIKITERETGKSVTPGPTPKRPVKELITAAFKVLEAQKKTTKEEFKEKYQKGKGISSLTEEELSSILNTVKQDFPHLNL